MKHGGKKTMDKKKTKKTKKTTKKQTTTKKKSATKKSPAVKKRTAKEITEAANVPSNIAEFAKRRGDICKF